MQGRIQDFKLRGAEGGTKFFGVFRVKNHVFTPKNHTLRQSVLLLEETGEPRENQ
jgi:hypothetical protein